uniref:PAS domain-containing protein n=2 Tax=Guillardia theta TaxID=55529 RepID=A0A7S4P2J9_GUITH|mmetsp:Transcript_41927/g.132186  ORF Transcript_41927/g.132186 Transcript_41927/m.132186 type:complete len:239 (+) Transcript_41927:328-1044(+)
MHDPIEADSANDAEDWNCFAATLLNSMGREIPACMLVDISRDDFPVVFVSDAMCRLVGRDRSELLSSRWDFFAGESSDLEDVEAVQKALRGSERCSRCVLSYRSDGSSFWNHIMAEPGMKYCLPFTCFSFHDVSLLFEHASSSQSPWSEEAALVQSEQEEVVMKAMMTMQSLVAAASDDESIHVGSNSSVQMCFEELSAESVTVDHRDPLDDMEFDTTRSKGFHDETSDEDSYLREVD